MKTWLAYLIEFRQRMMRCLGVFIVFFAILFVYAQETYVLFLSPLIKALPQGHGLQAIHVTSPVLTPISLACDFAVMMTLPYFLYQVWCFIAPALYPKEKTPLMGVVGMSVALFVLGILFAYCIVLPYLFVFFAQSVPKGVQWFPDMTEALDFMMRMLMVFGLSFQLPLLCVVLEGMQWMTLEQLKKIRPYVIVLAFIMGMLLTPPDVLSQCMLAIPLCLLYELGLFLIQLRRWRQGVITV